MNNLEINCLKNSYEGKRIFQSKMAGYEFDLFSDTWKLGYKKTLYLDWMNTLDSDVFLDLRLAIAHAAKHYASKSLITNVSILRTLCKYIEPTTFEAWWITHTSYKWRIKDALYALCKKSNEYSSTILTPLYNIVKDESLGSKGKSKNILDEKTGAYTEIERDNILEALRIETLNALDNEFATTSAHSDLCEHRFWSI